MTMFDQKKLLGEVLVDGEFITTADLTTALSEQKKTNERLGEILVRLGVLSDMELKAVLAANVELDDCPAGEGVRQRLGDILLKSKRINKNQLGRALEVQKSTNERLGEVLVRFGLITETELSAVLAWQDDCSKNAPHAVKLLLGEILVATDVIGREQLTEALKDQKLTKRQIGDILVEAGYVKPKQIHEALNIQSKLVSAALLAMLSMSALTGCGSSIPLVPEGSLIQGGARSSYSQIVNRASTVSYGNYGSQAAKSNYQTSSVGHGVNLLSKADGSFALLDNMPYVYQTSDNTCAQAAMSVVQAYWNDAATDDNNSYQKTVYQQTVNDTNRHNLPTTPETIQRYLTSKGLNAQAYKDGSIDYLKSLIKKGHAPIVLLDYGQLAEHYVVAVGYDNNAVDPKDGSKGVVYLQDSVEGRGLYPMSYEAFEAKWQNNSIANVPGVGGAKYRQLIIDAYK